MRRRARRGGGRQIDLTIEALGARGDGFAQTDEGLVFVPLSAPGDRLRVRIAGEKAGALRGEIVELLEDSPQRAEPPCPHFGPCGGCQLQHLSDAAYRAWTQESVGEQLARQGLDPAAVREVVAVPAGRRRRAVFAARRQGRRVRLGFHGLRSREIADLETCLIVTPEVFALTGPLRDLLAGWLPDGGEASVTVTETDTGRDVLVAGAPEPDLAVREAAAAFARTEDLARLSWTAAGAAPEPLCQLREPVLGLGKARVVLPPGGFLQPSREGEAALTALAAAALPTGAIRVADLYAGIGTFAFALADRPAGADPARVLAFEGDGPALAALEAAARQPAVQGRVAGERRDLDRQPLHAEELDVFDALVFDPPRAGAAAQAPHIAASRIPTVVAVSCNPASFARDARTLVDGGYALDAVTPVDQFPWSAHLELVAVFRK